jgi:hypothetical protein
MLLLKLSDPQGAMFDELPEADMGLHFPRVEDELGFVLSDRALMLLVTKRTQGLVHRVIDWAEQKEIGGQSCRTSTRLS